MPTPYEKALAVQSGLNELYGAGLTEDGVYGPNTQKALLQHFLPLMENAIVFAENNKKNHGVLSKKVSSPEEALEELRGSVRKNVGRFMRGERSSPKWDNSKTPKFVDFMQQRWAPVGVANDPKNLNKNWAPNVRHYIQDNTTPEQYNQLQNMNLVKASQPGWYA